MQHYDDERACNVEQGHERHQLFGNSGNALQTANDDKGRNHHQAQAGDEGRYAKSSVHVARDGINLAHVANAEGSQNAETGKQHCQHLAQLFAALLCAKTIGEVVHGTARPLAFFVFAAVVHAQHILRKAGHHAKQCHDPHPEDGTRPTGNDGRCHTHDVAGADGARQRRAHALELADGHILLAGVRGDVLVGEDRADGVPEPVAHFAELEKARAGAHPEAGAEQQCQTKRPPHHAIDGIVHLRDHLDHSLFPPIHKTKADRTHQRLCPQNSERSHFPQPGCAAFPAAPHCAKTMALSFCLRDTAAFPAALHLRHPLYKRASPECTVFPRRARLFQFFRRTVVRDRKTIPYSVLVRKTFCISYAAFSSVMPTDEFCFGITFVLPHHSAAINLFYFSFGSAPSNPRALPSGLASPFSFAVS